uniref:Uncharacterized protein n=1 Tax=Schlesneria paludicola TaxID=360056 RepID=A0A7C4QR57_9PLAN
MIPSKADACGSAEFRPLQQTTMHIHFAVYDPSEHSGQGSYWSWHAEALDRHLLDRLYYEVARHNRPRDPNALDQQTIVGGFARIESKWIFGYRFGNGGRDALGRPGRFVLMVAAVPTEQARQSDLTRLVDLEAIRQVIAAAPHHRPIKPPEQLSTHVTGELLEADPAVMQRVEGTGRRALTGPDVLRQAAAVCANLPADWLWMCQLKVGPQQGRAKIKRLSKRPQPDGRESPRKTSEETDHGGRPHSEPEARPRLGQLISQAEAWVCSGRFVSGLIGGFAAAMAGIFLFQGRCDVARKRRQPPSTGVGAPRSQPVRKAPEQSLTSQPDHKAPEEFAPRGNDKPAPDGEDQTDRSNDAEQGESHRRVE